MDGKGDENSIVKLRILVGVQKLLRLVGRRGLGRVCCWANIEVYYLISRCKDRLLLAAQQVQYYRWSGVNVSVSVS